MRRVNLGQLLNGNHEAQRVKAGASDVFRPRHAHQAEFTHSLDVGPGKLGDLVEVCGNGRHMFLGKCLDHVAHGQVLFGEVETVVHVGI